MQNLIQQTLLLHLPGKRKQTASGWLSFNAVCCIHNGESADRYGRGGLMLTSDGGINYHCFNCSFKAHWRPGIPLSRKFKNLLSWLYVPAQEIDKLRLETLKLGHDVKAAAKTIIIPQFPTVEPPPESRYFSELGTWYRLMAEQLIPKDLTDIVNYVSERHINLKKYDLMHSTCTEFGLNRRVIVPFYHDKKLVGWTARSVDSKNKLKYYSNQPQGYVFNLDKQDYDRKFVIVCEGPFDAMSVDGVATLGNTINDVQARQIKMLQRQVIVVPDHDSSGEEQINAAIHYNWAVSFPDWYETCKDINEAAIRYGTLFTLKNILDRTVTNPVKIELMKKKLFKNIKDN
jgi:hypothetical protein